MSKPRISAFERLHDIPEVFTLNTAAIMLKCSKGMASTYITRWREQGYISSLGPRAGIHFNLLKNPEAHSELHMDALEYLFPGAVTGGVSAVHAAGWTTQIPQQLEIMISERRTWPVVDNVEIMTRSLDWFREARKWIRLPGPVSCLDPAFALADCVHNKIWNPDPDDLEWDEINPTGLSRAFAYFGMDIPEAWAGDFKYLVENSSDSENRMNTLLDEKDLCL